MTPIGGRRPQRIARLGAVLAAAWAVLVLVPADDDAQVGGRLGAPCPNVATDGPGGVAVMVEVAGGGIRRVKKNRDGTFSASLGAHH